MSNPSGQVLMQDVIEDESLPLSTRLQAIREPAFRPTLAFLLRLIRDPATASNLKAAAVIRYNQILAIKEATRARRDKGSKKVTPATDNTAAEQL
jgi:hypothetical protein